MTTEMMTTAPAPKAPPALIARLVEQHGAQWIGAQAGADFLAAPGDCALLIAGDPVRFPEGLDVAVVLPELQRAFNGRFRIAVAEAASEDLLANRYGATRRPAVVFLRDGGFVATVSGMLDWDEYLKEVAGALALPVSRAPGIGIPVVSSTAASGCQ